MIKLAMVVNDLNINGISAVVFNYCTKIDKSKYKVYVFSGEPVNTLYCELAKKHSIEIIKLPERKSNTYVYYAEFFKQLRIVKPDIVHVHGNSATITPELFLAALSGTKIRIAHSHNTTCNNMKAHKLLYPFFSLLCNERFACGEEAGKWLFHDKKFHVIPNGFDVTRFEFDVEARRKYREELGFGEDDRIIGHVGRYNAQKNHPFLLKVFRGIAQKDNHAHLMLIGNGPDFDDIMKLIEEHPYKNRIHVLGERNDINKLYSAMDVFVLPSKHEGLVIALLEAQINGVHSVGSDLIPREVTISDNVEFLPLDEKQWVDAVLKVCKEGRSISKNAVKNPNIKKYNINENVKLLEKIYKDALRN